MDTRGKCRILAYIELVVGTIGSIIVAYFGGRKVKASSYDFELEYVRDWPTTLVCFLAPMLLAVILFAILMTLEFIMENQAKVLYLLKEQRSKIDDKSESNILAKSVSRDNKSMDSWVCTKCGDTNPRSIRICKGCGSEK
ncbi:MAG: hypothetical protein UFG06_05255 [Lachnospiraceae bacterium]|nr:hypothetical protein [Lachnospiraceae bacterium]